MKYLKYILFFCVSIANAAITDRYVSFAGSGAADGTSEANAMSYTTFEDYMKTAGTFTAAAGDRFNLISGTTYTNTSGTDAWVNGGTTTSPVIVRGYTTTITDGYQGRTGSIGGLVTTNMPTISYTTGVLNITSPNLIIESFQIVGARNGAPFSLGGTNVLLRACKVTNSAIGASGACLSISGRATIYNCDFVLTNGGNAGAQAVDLTTSGIRFLYNTVTSTAKGVNISSGASLIIAGNLIYNCAGNGLEITSTSAYGTFLNNTIVGSGGDAIHLMTGSTVEQCFMNNMLTDSTGDGIDMVTTSVASILAHQRTRDNLSNIANSGDWVTATNYAEVTTDTGGASTDYTNSGSNDFTLIPGSPATNAGWFYNNSIGAFQRTQSSSSSIGGSFTFGQ